MWHRRSGTTDTGHSQRLWPVFAILIAVVVLPTAGVLWFMKEAMQNEQYAVQRRLEEVYQSQLNAAVSRIHASWRKETTRLFETSRQGSKPEAFANLIKKGQTDSVLLYSDGMLVYPKTDETPNISAEPQTEPWREARNLEFIRNSPEIAAKSYAVIAKQSAAVQDSAIALIAEARCLNKSGKTQEAILRLTSVLSSARYKNISDTQGRFVFPNALLFTLQLIKDPSLPSFRKIATQLAERLNDYRDPAMPSTQRRFLMDQLRSLWPDCPQFPTLGAEELAAKVGLEKTVLDRLNPGQVQPTKVGGLWAYVAPDKSLIAILSQKRLMAFLNSAVSDQEPIGGIRISPLLPGATASAYLKIRMGEEFPSWQLGLTLKGTDPFQFVSKQKTAYVWIGVLMTAGIVMLSFLLAAYLQRQMRLTRLKNDLIATVSHELKTPLASMRLLVDTLRDGHYQDPHLVQDYLQLISKENARLSSLIEGFLTFSRMERNKAKFEQETLPTGDVIHAALEAVGNRLQAPGCRLELDLAPEMPAVIGDRSALITVFVNLLDNALKYTGEHKEIRLRSYVANSNICFEVQDNGIGFPRSAAKKIFDRFYQVDQTLSRNTGGCGLGLSIVQFIIAAHNGSVTARSQPGQGSIFTVQLPAA
jgi:signal transduction histidine kinase